MEYTIHVENFGKIRKASVKVAPLTLFVGGNNSGKSYLLALIWGLQSFEMQRLFLAGIEATKGYEALAAQIRLLVDGRQNEVRVSSDEFLPILNEVLHNNKENLVRNVFNGSSVSIGKLWISVQENYIFTIRGKGDEFSFFEEGLGKIGSVNMVDPMSKEDCAQHIMEYLCSLAVMDSKWNTIYFPAARTGFVLAKDAINKAARKSAFDTIRPYGENNIEPFTKPIMNFLDAMNMPTEQKTSGKNQQLLDWIQREMSHGKVNYRDDVTRNIEYYPEGLEVGLPLRTVSAVVTELTPLMLLLQHKEKLQAICYEEPEMCLHPQLQLKMARLLVRMVAAGTTIVATTHSDIILQYINNACTLSSLGKPEELLSALELTEEDCISVKDVAVYQFEDYGSYSEVRTLKPTKRGFEVPTFKDALQEILNQTSEVYTYEEQGE